MALIKSISGIRGTIGGKAGDGFSPIDIIRFTTAFSFFIKNRSGKMLPTVVIGKDARISGKMVEKLVAGTLMGCGVNVIDLGFSTTPTVEMAVTDAKADGGIILTASHNPRQWNALKLLNEKGEFLSSSDGQDILKFVAIGDFNYAEVDDLGSYEFREGAISKHIADVLALPLVDVDAIRKANFRVAIDCVNSTGGIALPELLEELGVKKIDKLYCEPSGEFPHNPEPLPEHLGDIAKAVVDNKADLGFVVDPDVDRLAIVCENGEMFGEEYTLVAVADYILQHKKGNTVSNMSSSMALKDVTEKHGGKYSSSAVGEVNVVEKMKEVDAVIGGEGNGGIIYPELHNGRDALVGIALFLTHLAKVGVSCSELRKTYPEYHISKNKIKIEAGIDVDDILLKVRKKFADQDINTIDGVKIVFGKEWVHLRKSNTEPIIRIYSESSSKEAADKLARNMINDILSFVD
jgi:phosphomannomutase